MQICALHALYHFAPKSKALYLLGFVRWMHSHELLFASCLRHQILLISCGFSMKSGGKLGGDSPPSLNTQPAHGRLFVGAATSATPPATLPPAPRKADTCAQCPHSSAARQRPSCPPAGCPASGRAGPGPGASAPAIWALRARNPSSSRHCCRYTGRSTSFSTSRVTVT